MNPHHIIKKKVSAEGFNIPTDVLFSFLMNDIKNGKMKIFYYHPVVFVVSSQPEYPVVHLFSDDAGHSIMSAGQKFMAEVWDHVPHTELVAPILSRKVKSFARRFGWKSTGKFTVTGHEVFLIKRP